MPAHLHQAYRRNAKASAQQHRVKKHKDEELLQRAREDFGFFCEYVADKPPAKHHKEWHRQLVTKQDSSCLFGIAGPNIDLLGPRGSAKSTCLGLFTAWAIGIHTTAKKPLQILYLSYTVDIARSKSATIKRIIESKKYQEVFPMVKLLKNVTSNEYWSIDHRFAGIDLTGDEQFTLCAAGLKGSVTSKRSHLCLVGDTLVATNVGNVPVASIYEHPERYKVAVRNSRTDQIDWSDVAAVTKRRTKGIIEITTASGNKICATPEHPFITANGRKKRAGNLSAGETLVQLSNWQQDQNLSCLWETKKKNTTYLRGLLQNNIEVSSRDYVPTVQRNFYSNVQNFGGKAVQGPSCDSLQSSMRGGFTKNSVGTTLLELSNAISSSQQIHKMLLQGLRGFPTFQANAKNWQQQLQTRLPFKRLQKTSSINSSTGQFYLCRMQYQGNETVVKRWIQQDKSLCSSYRSSTDQQYPRKFNHIVSPVPCSSSPAHRQSWEAESISGVKFFSEREEFVYDLEVVHKDHNFIANGLNTLNCLIDDPVKSSADIANPDIRKMMQDNWNAVIAPTMFEGARAICLGTRFRHDDIHATTFNSQNNWQQIVLSAIQNNDETGEEESYWPEMWSLEYLKEKKRQAPIAFSFQYMNQIVRLNELSLAPELLVKAEIATEFDSLAIGVDLSAGTKEKNDYTVMTLGGRIGDKIHIIDYRRLRVMGNLEKLDALKELLNDWSIIARDQNGLYYPTYNTCDIYSEAVQYQASLEADFKRVCLTGENLYNLIWHPVKGFRSDKLARFRGCMGIFEDRKLIFNRYRNFSTMFDELTNFGVSSHDDCVDSLVFLINGLLRKGRLQIDY